MTDKKINYDIDNQTLIEVPRTVTKCPYCGADLEIHGVDEWSTGDDGAIIPEHIELDCSSLPVFDGTREAELAERHFLRTHSEMPYVRWLSVEEKVMAWFRGAYNFVRPQHERELLAKWIAAANGEAKG